MKNLNFIAIISISLATNLIGCNKPDDNSSTISGYLQVSSNTKSNS